MIVEGESAIGLDRIDFMLDGQASYTARALGATRFQAAYPWFAAELGDHQISAIGYDRLGSASQPVSVTVRVQAADIRSVLADSEPLDPAQSIEEIAAQPGAPAAQPPAPPAGADAPAPADDANPPVVELVLNRLQRGGAAIAQLQLSARDDVGMRTMQLSAQSPAGANEIIEYDCEGHLECRWEPEYPLAESGRWIFTLDGTDTAGLIAQPQFAWLDIVCGPNQVCEPADPNDPAPAGPLPGDPPQGDGVPPTVEMLVTPRREDGIASVQVEMRAHDEAGLQLMIFSLRSPSWVPEQFAVDCGGRQDCNAFTWHLTQEAGEWLLALQAFDLSAQEAHQIEIVQVICNAGADANGQPIQECAIANGEAPAAGDQPGAPGAAAPQDPAFWDPGENPFIDPIDVAAPILCFGAPAPDVSFDTPGGCRIVLPVDADRGVTTSCTSADLSGVDLRGVDLHRANLLDVNLTGANLSCGADLRGADLRYTTLTRTRLDDSTRIDPKWRLVWELDNGSGYERDLTGADLSEARLVEADLFGADLTNANFRGSRFEHANLLGADLTGADLSETLWTDTICPDGTRSGDHGDTCVNHLQSGLPRRADVRIGDCLIVQPVPRAGPYTDCPQARFNNADLRQLDLTNAGLYSADFTAADLRGTILTGADLRLVNWRWARVDPRTRLDAKWLGVWLLVNLGGRGRDLSGEDLSFARLDGASLEGASLNNANLEGASLWGAHLDGAQLNGTRWLNTTCPDGTYSNDVGGTCLDHLAP